MGVYSLKYLQPPHHNGLVSASYPFTSARPKRDTNNDPATYTCVCIHIYYINYLVLQNAQYVNINIMFSLYIYICMYVRIYCIYLYVCMYEYIVYIYTYICMSILYIFICMYVRVYCIYIYTY